MVWHAHVWLSKRALRDSQKALQKVLRRFLGELLGGVWVLLPVLKDSQVQGF